MQLVGCNLVERRSISCMMGVHIQKRFNRRGFQRKKNRTKFAVAVGWQHCCCALGSVGCGVAAKASPNRIERCLVVPACAVSAQASGKVYVKSSLKLL